MSVIAGTGFARFMELRGRCVVEKYGVLWHSAGFGMYMSLPYHLRVELDPAEAGRGVRSMRAAGIRYPSLLWDGLPSGEYLCDRRDYDLNALHRNFRSFVRHGLPYCEIRGVAEAEMLTQALEINRHTMSRQGRYDAEFGDAGQWRRLVRAIGECPCIASVGAFVDGQLASYAITCLEDGWLHILYKMTSFQFDSRHPSQVLDYTITRQIATDPAIKTISMGWAPLVARSGLHDYKLRLGYRFEPQSSVICLHPAAHYLLGSRLSLEALRLASKVFRKSQPLSMSLAVIEGARLARNGRRQQPAQPEPAARGIAKTLSAG